MIELRARQQRHPDHHRQIDALALVRDPARLGRARSGAAVRQYQRPRHRRRGARARADPEEDGARGRRDRAFRSAGPIWSRSLAVAVALGVGELDPALARDRERRSRVPDRHRRRRGALRPVAVAARQRRRLALLQFLLPAADLHLHHRRSRPTSRRSSSSSSWRSSSPMSPRACAPRPSPRMARARTTESLYAFSRKLAGVGTLDDVLWATAYQTALMLKVRVVLLLPERRHDRRQGRLSAGGHARRGGSRGRQMGLGEQPAGRARLGYACRAPNGCSCRCAPAAAPIGVVGIDSDKPGPLLTPDQRRLLDALIDQARAGHRARPPGRGHGPGQAHGRDRPLALGAADLDLARSQDAACGRARRGRHAARPVEARSSDAEKADLLATIIDESERLNRFIANLLDMTKLESGAVVPNAALHDLGEIVGSALAAREQDPGAASGRAGARRRSADARARRGAVRAGAVQPAGQRGQICAAGTTIRIQSWRDEDAVCLQVLDEGDGIPPGDLEHIFDKFYRAQKGDQVRAGTGLGPCDLARLRRGHARHHHGGQPHRSDRRGVHDQACRSQRGSKQLDTAA